MVELKSCASLVNASALCGIEQEVKGGEMSANAVVAEMSAELEKERQKNALLKERISLLEAQIQDFIMLSNGQGNCSSARERSFKKFKRQKVKRSIEDIEAQKLASETQCMRPKDANRLINWMSTYDTQLFDFRDGDSAANCDDTYNTDNCHDEYFDVNEINVDHTETENGNKEEAASEIKELLEGVRKEIDVSCKAGSSGDQVDSASLHVNRGSKEDTSELNKHDTGELKANGEYQALTIISSMQKKSPKVAFCPKEVKKIINLEELLQENAQSHTIRKIIVFASLGIRHGCDDMYELDFNHFSIVKKGEPYVSSSDPGEHVLYENPGVQRKIFYRNRQNQTLCPLRILEQERAMRPSDTSCPSCLFLCIKYGGRTRNLPQNEYVRQRMGRNKLKSFGPLICRMALLVHIRSGSFFFKALGITLLFMAGFPDDLVQKETKYRNLDILQKYYRTDADAEGEELFLTQTMPCDTNASPVFPQLDGKKTLSKSKGKKHTSSVGKLHNPQKASTVESAPSTFAPPTQFGLMGYTSIQTQAMTAFQSMPSQTPADSPPALSNPSIKSSTPKYNHHNRYSYPVPPPHPANSFMPLMYWSSPNVFPPCTYSPSYGYPTFPPAGNYIPIHPLPYYCHTSCSSLVPKPVQGSGRSYAASAQTDGDSNSSSSTTHPYEDQTKLI
ncbi:hypothetical protein RJ639_011354 [Escallonia herrerae]|uniref:Homer protein n=1 Tax=Escallonia herrerae TaxID=1293975 RepID=A0AA88VQ62_9ASTE|nr:hypothetical protein RJ639_011354 [Escallonia herrerae]